MIGVLLLAHGSREKDTEHTMQAIRDYVKEELNRDDIIVEEAYMEFRNINLDGGILKLMEQGATEIKIVPYFLFEGVHIKRDIPYEIAAFQEKHPQVKITFGKTLGPDRRLAAVLADRVKELI